MPRGRSKGAFFRAQRGKIRNKGDDTKLSHDRRNRARHDHLRRDPAAVDHALVSVQLEGVRHGQVRGPQEFYTRVFQHVLEILAVSRKHLCVRHWQAAR